MANSNKPHGFRPLYRLGGGVIAAHSYPVAAANTAIGIGDIVNFTNAGVIDKAAASATQIIGVAAESKGASAGGYCLVYDDMDIVFEGQTDDGTGTLSAQAGVNLNANFVATAASGGMSVEEIDENTGNTTATLPFKIIGLYSDPENAFGEFNRLLFIINNHAYKSVGVDGV